MKHVWIAGIAAGLLAGCSSSSTTSDQTPPPVTPPTSAAVPTTSAAASITAASDAPTYANVQKIFTAACVKCHGLPGGRVAAGLSLTSYDVAMKGGRSGADIVAGDANSALIQYITGAKTPPMPRNAPPLAAQDINLIKAWIVAGAKNP